MNFNKKMISYDLDCIVFAYNKEMNEIYGKR